MHGCIHVHTVHMYARMHSCTYSTYVRMHGCIHVHTVHMYARMHSCTYSTYVCMDAFMYVHMYAWMHSCTYICMHGCIHVRTYVCMDAFMYVHMYAWMHSCTYSTYVCMDAFMYVHMWTPLYLDLQHQLTGALACARACMYVHVNFCVLTRTCGHMRILSEL